MCAGTIITEWHILTAAHCLFGVDPLDDKSFVIVGEHNIEDGVNEGGQNISVADYYIHEGYKTIFEMIKGYKSVATVENDIAILRLEEKIKLTNKVGLIEWRDSPSANYDGEIGIATGWGYKKPIIFGQVNLWSHYYKREKYPIN